MLSHLFQIACLLGLSSILLSPGYPEVENRTFEKGEYLEYRVHYGFLTGGFASIEVAEQSVTKAGRSCHHLRAKGWTNPTFDLFYKVRDTYESFVDEKSLLPLHFRRDIREGSFRSFTEVYFDHHQDSAIYFNPRKLRIPYAVPDNIQDVISAFFYARTTQDPSDFSPGDALDLRCFLDRKVFALKAELLEREVIKIAGEEYKSLHFKLLVEEVGLITDGGSVEFWISDDANKIVLRIKSDLLIGSLKADLIKAKGLKHPFLSRQ
jgi:hypothetical protein